MKKKRVSKRLKHIEVTNIINQVILDQLISFISTSNNTQHCTASFEVFPFYIHH